MEIVLGCIGVLTVQNFVCQGRGQLLAVKAATQAPEEVSRITYQTMDICTRGEPNRVMH